MFSGIVEETANVVALGSKDPLRLTVQSRIDHSETKLGDSIAINGVCLTVVEKNSNALSFDLAAETVRRTTLGELKSGDSVNLERSLKVGERLHGHFVFGHVDATVQLLERVEDGQTMRLVWELPTQLRAFVASKGSVSIAGVSLTVGEKLANGFSVYIIPHTLTSTILGTLKVGQKANLEIDMLARYVQAATSGDRQ